MAQLVSAGCELNGHAAAHLAQKDELSLDCMDFEVTLSVNASDGAKVNHTLTLHSLAKYRYYRFQVAAATNAGVGEYTRWSYARTLAGSKNIMVIF